MVLLILPEFLTVFSLVNICDCPAFLLYSRKINYRWFTNENLYVFRILKYSQVIFRQEETVVDRNKLHINIIYRMKMELGMCTEKIQSQRY